MREIGLHLLPYQFLHCLFFVVLICCIVWLPLLASTRGCCRSSCLGLIFLDSGYGEDERVYNSIFLRTTSQIVFVVVVKCFMLWMPILASTRMLQERLCRPEFVLDNLWQLHCLLSSHSSNRSLCCNKSLAEGPLWQELLPHWSGSFLRTFGHTMCSGVLKILNTVEAFLFALLSGWTLVRQFGVVCWKDTRLG